MKACAKACGHTLGELKQAHRAGYLSWPPLPAGTEVASVMRRMLLGQPVRKAARRS